MSDFSPAEIAALKSLAALVIGGGRPAGTGAASGIAPASDDELDSSWGNPDVHKDPPRWTGASYQGARFSDCPSDYLNALASFFMWRAGKEDADGKKDKKDRPKSDWSRKDAARAIGWSRRNAGLSKPPPTRSATAGAGEFDDPPDGASSMPANEEDIPF